MKEPTTQPHAIDPTSHIVRFSTVPRKQCSIVRHHTKPLAVLLASIEAHGRSIAAKNGPAILPSLFCVGDGRTNATRGHRGRFRQQHLVETCTLLLYDYDGATLSPEKIAAIWTGLGLAVFVWTTWSHGNPDKPGTYVRVLLVPTRETTADEYAQLWAWGATHSAAHGAPVDQACKDPTRLSYTKRLQAPRATIAPWSKWYNGAALNPDALPDGQRVGGLLGSLAQANAANTRPTPPRSSASKTRPAPSHPRRTSTRRRKRRLGRGGNTLHARHVRAAQTQLANAKEDVRTAQEGTRHDTLCRWAYTLGGWIDAEYQDHEGNWHRVDALTHAEITQALDQAARQAYGRDYGGANAANTIRDALTKGQQLPFRRTFDARYHTVRATSTVAPLDTRAEALRRLGCSVVIRDDGYYQPVDLTPVGEQQLVIVSGSQGTGKTFCTAEITRTFMAQGGSTAVLTPRALLAEGASPRFNIRNYADARSMTPEEARDWFCLSGEDGIAMCLDSLHRLRRRRRTSYNLVLDESEQIVRHLYGATIGKREGGATRYLRLLRDVIERAACVFALDADAGAVTTALLRGHTNTPSPKEAQRERHVLHRQHAHRDMTMHTRPEGVVQAFLEDIAANHTLPVIAAAASARDAQRLTAMLEGKTLPDEGQGTSNLPDTTLDPLLKHIRSQRNGAGPRVLLVCADTRSDKDVEAFIKDPSTEVTRYDAVLLSPSGGTGIDISTPVARMHFLGAWVSESIFSGRDARDHMQHITRPRRIVPPDQGPHMHAWVAERVSDLPTTPEAVAHAAQTRAEIVQGLGGVLEDVGIDAEGDTQFRVADPFTFDLWCLAVAESNRHRADHRGAFVALALARGWDLREAEELNDHRRHVLREHRKRAQEELRLIDVEETSAITVLTSDDVRAQDMRAGLGTDRDAERARTRYFIADQLGADHERERSIHHRVYDQGDVDAAVDLVVTPEAIIEHLDGRSAQGAALARGKALLLTDAWRCCRAHGARRGRRFFCVPLLEEEEKSVDLSPCLPSLSRRRCEAPAPSAAPSSVCADLPLSARERVKARLRELGVDRADALSACIGEARRWVKPVVAVEGLAVLGWELAPGGAGWTRDEALGPPGDAGHARLVRFERWCQRRRPQLQVAGLWAGDSARPQTHLRRLLDVFGLKLRCRKRQRTEVVDGEKRRVTARIHYLDSDSWASAWRWACVPYARLIGTEVPPPPPGSMASVKVAQSVLARRRDGSGGDGGLISGRLSACSTLHPFVGCPPPA